LDFLQSEGAASFDKSWNDPMACIESKSAGMRDATLFQRADVEAGRRAAQPILDTWVN
jgi:hypothetical protein